MKRMLFNATQAEELRVAIVDGQKLIDLDIESAAKEQRKSNIYKGVITRLEPSLEACFVDYDGNRHGFLPFKEVSRSYFQPGVDVGRARINDVLREGQEVIVQVDKDERGNKGAALTTFISLAGRHLVLMPNNPRGGGVSRRVDGDERAELRDAMDQLEVPAGMSLIARTAAIGRQVEELQWDLNYLLQLWQAIDSVANENKAPLLIYQEGSLVIRAIRDYFQPEIGEILIDTDDVFDQARAFMGQVMPNNVSRVKRYSDDVPLFSRFQIEHQIETAFARQVDLPSGGAIVIDHTEALVAVDVNSGRSTRGADIEETALKTNLEAADEIGRQLRLRDLGGLIVIDFIDMEPQKNQREVENRLRDALRYDRARVQMGKISRFGLMELSRQRLRPALAETSYITCPRCTGTGHIRSTESAALHILRILEEEAMKDNTAAVHVQVPVDVATFLLNEKRHDIQTVELRHKVSILLLPNIHLETPAHSIVRLRHDDLNNEEQREPSYKMAELPPEEVLRNSQGSADQSRPRQEAAIKHITLPPPISSAQPSAKPGLFARFMSLFTSDKAKTTTPAISGEKNNARRDTRRDNDNRSRGDRSGRRRREEFDGDKDTRQESRGEKRSPRTERGEKTPAERPARQNNREEGITKPEAAEAAPRRERRPRREAQPVSSAPVGTPTPKVALASEKAPHSETSSNDQDGTVRNEDVQSSGLHRRSRRGGGRRRRGESTVSGDLPEGSDQAYSQNEAPAPAISPVAVSTNEPVVATRETPAAVAQVTSNTDSPQMPQLRADVAPTPSPVREVPPVHLPEPVVAPPPVQAPKVVAEPVTRVNLEQALASSGLVIVSTATTSAPPQPEQETRPHLGRVRRRPANTTDEPMVVVETQNKP